MTFSRDEIRHLATLARLGLSDVELTGFQRDLDEIVGIAQRLQEVDVKDVVPMTHAVPMALPLRDDVVTPVVGRAGVIASAGYEDGLVRVPKIIE